MLREEVCDFGNGIRERRPVALAVPDTSRFEGEDIEYLDEATAYYWLKTGREASDESHGIAWRSRYNGDPMPYESALLSDRPLNPSQAERLRSFIGRMGFVSD
jgi:hypothetical protein